MAKARRLKAVKASSAVTGGPPSVSLSEMTVTVPVPPDAQHEHEFTAIIYLTNSVCPPTIGAEGNNSGESGGNDGGDGGEDDDEGPADEPPAGAAA